ncbi:hypothetical protein [Lacimicrobium sp. SS2-24]|nr:hypothetical protein [Lacimicrobium sp. SS2-24]
MIRSKDISCSIVSVALSKRRHLHISSLAAHDASEAQNQTRLRELIATL